MEEPQSAQLEAVLARIKSQAAAGAFRVTQHAQQEMVEEDISLDEVLAALQRGEVVEHYPEHRRGACSLVSGETDSGRAVHIVCATAHPLLVLITVYEPKPPKWMTPRQRRPRA
ncbi:MAG TPA: DUF4258 domain-containing protein [Terriglobia bacterium]